MSVWSLLPVMEEPEKFYYFSFDNTSMRICSTSVPEALHMEKLHDMSLDILHCMRKFVLGLLCP